MRDDARPWHREPWVWFVVALPAVAVAASFAALGLAIATDDGVVADDYYRRGLAVNQVLRREARARELHLAASADLAGDRVTVSLRGTTAPPPGLRLRLVHPTRSGRDQTVLLRASGSAYEGRLAPLNGEPRLLVLEDEGSTWRLTGTWNGRDKRAELGSGG
ncbi:MAG TPA: FixH family protein [Burkholderiales bacterium]|nr:FixH family protein [Burkholderiales bacterium]